MQAVSCLCGSSDYAVLRDKSEREKAGVLRSVVIRAPDNSIIHGRNVFCNNCGLVYVSPRMSQHELDHFYRHDYRKIYGGDGTGKSHILHADNAYAALKELGLATDSHLDIGCSTGALIALTGGCGIEPNKEHYAIAREKGLNVQCVTIEEYEGGPFDLITMMNALEHVADPVAVLTKLRSLLTDNGRAMVSVPDLYGKIVNIPADAFLSNAHLYNFSEMTLMALFLRCGIKPVAMAKVTESIGLKLYMVGEKAEPKKVLPSVIPGQFEMTKKHFEVWDQVYLAKKFLANSGFI